MARDVVDLDAAIAAASEALRRFATEPHGDLACVGPDRAALIAVHAAAEVLGLVDISTVGQVRDGRNPPAVYTDTVTPPKEYL